MVYTNKLIIINLNTIKNVMTYLRDLDSSDGQYLGPFTSSLICRFTFKLSITIW